VAEAEPCPAGPAGLGAPAQGRDVRQLAAGFGVGTATAWRYVDETVALLAARAPKLRQAVRAAARTYPYAVLDGTLILTDRVAADRPPASLVLGERTGARAWFDYLVSR
jgi:hypothetical protein